MKENGRENVTVRIRIETDIVTVSSIFRFLFRFMAMNSIVFLTLANLAVSEFWAMFLISSRVWSLFSVMLD